MNNTDSNQNQTNRPSRKGNLNPMANRHHSMQSRQKMSDSHKAYQQRIRQQQSNNGQGGNYVMKPMTMQEFLSNNPSLDIKGYIQSLMKNEEILREIIREEIKKRL